jgi:hypothetical protein
MYTYLSGWLCVKQFFAYNVMMQVVEMVFQILRVNDMNRFFLGHERSLFWGVTDMPKVHIP